MKRIVCLLPLLLALPMAAQTASSATSAAPDPWKALAFLQGTWEAKTSGTEVVLAGTYTFQTELKDHIMARHSYPIGGCKGPADFDCDHSDLLYIFQETPGQPLKAIYFDNEGHVLHYDVTTPDATTVVFLTDAGQPGPQFRLTYQLKGAVMNGKFQMLPPGQKEWRSYLEWSGSKQPKS